MAISIYNSILDSVVSQVNSLGLAIGAKNATVVKRKLPAYEESIDGPLPMIAVVPSEKPEYVKKLGFEDSKEVGYTVQVVIIAANNRDMATNLDAYLNWRKSIRDLFRSAPLSGVSQVWDMETLPDVPIDRAVVNQDYDYSSLSFLFRTAE